MMKRVALPLFGSSGGYFGQQFDPQRTVNMFHAKVPNTEMQAYITIPGTETIYTQLAGDNTRLLFNAEDNLFAVFSTELVNFNSAFTPVSVGNFNTSSGHIGSAANNVQQIMFVDNVDGWVYDFSTMTPTFTQITDAGFTAYNGPVDVDFFAGRMIVGFSSSNRFSVSQINDATTWPGLGTAFVESKGNQKIRGIRVIQERIFIFGDTVTELWYDAEAPGDLPFRKDTNLVIPYGCAATGSIATGEYKQAEVLVWLAKSEIGPIRVMATTGGRPEPISDDTIEYLIQNFTNISEAQGYMYEIDGHTFYLINFPTDRLTAVYDFDMKEWHYQELINGDPYFSCCHAYFQNKHVLGHYNAAQITELNSDFLTNYNENIRIERVLPIFSVPSNERLLIDRIQVEMRQGLGAKTTRPRGDNTYDDFELNPVLYLAYSSDGGRTFGDQVPSEVGKVGEGDFITTWDVHTLSDRQCFKLIGTYGNKTILINMSAQVSNKGY